MSCKLQARWMTTIVHIGRCFSLYKQLLWHSARELCLIHWQCNHASSAVLGCSAASLNLQQTLTSSTLTWCFFKCHDTSPQFEQINFTKAVDHHWLGGQRYPWELRWLNVDPQLLSKLFKFPLEKREGEKKWIAGPGMCFKIQHLKTQIRC